MPKKLAKISQETEDRFLDDFKSRLIKLVQDHPCIWHERGRVQVFRRLTNTNAEIYQSWKEIAQTLKTPMNICQARWHALCQSFMQEQKKDTVPKYQKNKFKHYNSMLFLAIKMNNVRLPPPDLPSLIPQCEAALNSNPPPEIKKEPSALCKFEDKLIEQVRMHENLWNMSLPSYTDEILKRQSWREISTALKTSSKKCQTTFDILRDDYFQIYCQQENPQWEFYDSLRFLDTINDLYQTSLPGISECVSPSSLTAVPGRPPSRKQPVRLSPKMVISTNASSQIMPGIEVDEKKSAAMPCLDPVPKLLPMTSALDSEPTNKIISTTPLLLGPKKTVVVKVAANPGKRVKLENDMPVSYLLQETAAAAGFIKDEPSSHSIQSPANSFLAKSAEYLRIHDHFGYAKEKETIKNPSKLMK